MKFPFSWLDSFLLPQVSISLLLFQAIYRTSLALYFSNIHDSHNNSHILCQKESSFPSCGEVASLKRWYALYLQSIQLFFCYIKLAFALLPMQGITSVGHFYEKDNSALLAKLSSISSTLDVFLLFVRTKSTNNFYSEIISQVFSLLMVFF